MFKNSIVLFLCLLVLSCHNNDKKQNIESPSEALTNASELCVENILKKDSEYGEIRNHESEQLSISKTIDNYTTNLKSLDYTKCPENFSSAFSEHINAWLAIKKVTDNYPNLRGELHSLFTVLENEKDSVEFKVLSKQIWDSWKLVEIASKK